MYVAFAVGHVPGPNFGRKPAKIREQLTYIFKFLIYIYSKRFVVLDLSTRFLFVFVRGPRSRALGVDSGPRGRVLRGFWTPNKIKDSYCFHWSKGAYVV